MTVKEELHEVAETTLLQQAMRQNEILQEVVSSSQKTTRELIEANKELIAASLGTQKMLIAIITQKREDARRPMREAVVMVDEPMPEDVVPGVGANGGANPFVTNSPMSDNFEHAIIDRRRETAEDAANMARAMA